jgi:methylation protein EvaC
MSFGKMPLANGFLTMEQFDKEYFFEMEVAFCNHCNMFQLVNQPDRERMFNEHYAFYSNTSKYMGFHFHEFAEEITKKYLINTNNPFVVEIGSNDGILLQNFAQKGIRHLGIEPSENVAKVALAKGINTIVKFFDKTLAEEIVFKHGQADAFVAANVMCHIPYIKSIVEGIHTLVKKEGIVVFEEPYLGDVIAKTTYDQIYDEHTFLFSVHSIKYLFGLFEMEIVDVEPQETHGGSMRYTIAHKGMRTISEKVLYHLEKEKVLGLQNLETYYLFKQNCENSRSELLSVIQEVKKLGKRIVGYAATSKSTTIINYCGLTQNDLDYICDTTPIKQNKFSPGAHIPVVPYEIFINNYPDCALLFGYNHSKEIMEKETTFMNKGGKWIVYVPKIEIK